MADKKISQLTDATLPLSGTEVLPIVQSGTTVKVTNNNLRPLQIQSNATSGVLQVTGPAAASTRVMTTPDANFTAARTDAAQSFTGDQTLTTGNLVIGTSGKGIDFSATSDGSGTATSELLADYEEGTFTPSILFGGNGVGITYTTQSGRYTKVGREVTVEGKIVLSNKGSSTGTMTLRGMPYTISADSYPTQTVDTAGGWSGLTTGGCLFFVAQQATTYGYIMVQGTTNRGTIDQTYFTNTTDLRFSFTYTV